MPKLSESHDSQPAPERRPSTPKIRQRAEQQRSHDTRAALITTARRLFAEQGYHATGTGEIVELAQVTRGALYHHFSNKEDLFEAVYRQAERELTQEAQTATLAMQGQPPRRAQVQQAPPGVLGEEMARGIVGIDHHHGAGAG